MARTFVPVFVALGMNKALSALIDTLARHEIARLMGTKLYSLVFPHLKKLDSISIARTI